jgi:hypothetical protein
MVATFGELWAVLNVAEVDRPLVPAWLVTAIDAGIPHPILNLTGEQGTGKSTAAKVITSLLDPSPAPLRKAPRDAGSSVTEAAGSWIVAIDNISTVPDWLSDTCAARSPGMVTCGGRSTPTAASRCSRCAAPSYPTASRSRRSPRRPGPPPARHRARRDRRADTTS